MLRRLILAAALLAACAPARAQVYPSIPPNTLLGRLGAGQAGQPQQIPITSLACTTSQLGLCKPDGSTITSSGGTLTASPITLGGQTYTPGSTYNTLMVTTPVNTTTHGLIIKQTGPLGETSEAPFNYNGIAIADTTDDTTAGGIINGWFIDIAETGGTGTTGSIYAANSEVNFGGTSTGTGDMVGQGASCISTANYSGGVGGCYGAAFGGILTSNASLNSTNGEVAGVEADSRIDSGSSAAWQFGVGSVKTGTGAGTLLDAAYEVGGAVGSWKNGLLLNSGHSQPPLTTGGCVICTDGVAETIATGMDLSAYTISGNFLKGPGFAVSGTGAVSGIGLSVKSGSASAEVGQLAATITGVNFNSANTDNAINIPLPTGYSNYRITGILISNASASLTTATCGVFSATGGGGTAIVASATAITISTGSTNTNNNQQVLTFSNSNTEAFNFSTIYFRVQTAEGSAATGTVTVFYQPVS
jgi:hypothetical protein